MDLRTTVRDDVKELKKTAEAAMVYALLAMGAGFFNLVLLVLIFKKVSAL